MFHEGDLDAAIVPFEAGATIMDARAPVVEDAGRDTAMDAFVPAGPPGAEVGRLAGFTAAHNAARARVGATPALEPFTWSEEIAIVAQGYAEKLAAGCLDTLEHSTREERHFWGENLASYKIEGGTGREENGNALITVELWESEINCYTYGPFQPGVNDSCTAACSAYGGCGHYTQMVWRDTKRVGCGVADCVQGRTRKSYWVCNYDPPGNYINELPY